MGIRVVVGGVWWVVGGVWWVVVVVWCWCVGVVVVGSVVVVSVALSNSHKQS